MNDLGMYLRAILRKEKYGSINYRIAEYLLNNSNQIDHLSTSLIAKKCYVSKSAVSRFCKVLGVEDFSELKYLLKRYTLDIDERFDVEHYQENENQNYLMFIDKSIKKMSGILNEQLVDELASCIHRYEKVILMGISKSNTAAITLQHDLVYLHKWVRCVEDINEQKEILTNASEDTLIIIFSASGSFLQKVLPRDRVMDREHRPSIYVISCQPAIQSSYLTKNIILNHKVDFSSHILMDIFVHLLVLRYRTINHIVSELETKTTF